MIQKNSKNVKGLSLFILFFLLTAVLLPVTHVWAQKLTPISVSGKGNFTVTLLSDGTIWAWGHNEKGQLSDKTTIDRKKPIQVGTDTNWAKISTGWDHVLALKSDGSIWGWGDNKYTQLGETTSKIRNPPVRIGTSADWVAIEAGEDTSFAIKSDGSLWAWGRNDHGQMGNGDKRRGSLSSPTRLGKENNWKTISTFFTHIMAIKNDGTLWGWGDNHYFQLGEGTGSDVLAPIQIGIEKDWKLVSAGDSHSLALKTNGTIWGTGRNMEGQLGNPPEKMIISRQMINIGKDSDWVQISAGGFHSLASKEDGTLWGWGHNFEGQLASGTHLVSMPTPTQIGNSFRWGLFFAGNDHSMAVNGKGELIGWGWNMYGQVGINSTRQTISKPIVITIN